MSLRLTFSTCCSDSGAEAGPFMSGSGSSSGATTLALPSTVEAACTVDIWEVELGSPTEGATVELPTSERCGAGSPVRSRPALYFLLYSGSRKQKIISMAIVMRPREETHWKAKSCASISLSASSGRCRMAAMPNT